MKEKSKLTEQVSYSAFIGNKVVKFQKNFIEGSFIIGVTEDYGGIFNIEIASGRFFNRNDVINGTNTVVIGYEVAQGLFGPADPIGRIVVLGGKKLQVIGVIAKTGKSLINPLDFDEACLVSYKTAQFYINLRGGSFFASINAKAKKGIDIADFRDEITGLLRAERRIKPMDESNFAINELSMLNKIFDSVFGVLKLAGLIIGGFAILVGMFSVANIMFVSVKERTHIIGIKKAIGATRNVILLEFLIESVVLCILGGILGLIFVFGVLKVASALTEFEMTLSISNILVGLVLSILVGILAGVIPAFNAAKMDPVEAIRQG
ncbi:MAG: ABC transporter permease [Saprospiraceae bacterium]|nr:ABC transporter permease [Candidatus Brachybacter algidus]